MHGEVLPSRQMGAGVSIVRRRCRRLLMVQPSGLTKGTVTYKPVASEPQGGDI